MNNLEEAYKKDIERKILLWERSLKQTGLAHMNVPIVPTPVRDGYRSRAKFKVFKQGEDITVCGTDPARGEVLYERMLWILPEWGRDFTKNLKQNLLLQYPAYEVDGFEIQLTHGQELAHVTLSIKKTRKDTYAALAGTLLEQVPGLVGVAIPSQNLKAGETYLNHYILDFEIKAHHAAFFQSNICLLPDLLKTVEVWLEGIDRRSIKDVYCGVGLFSLFAGEECSHILGVDNNHHAIDSARMNADTLGFSRSEFICSSVERFIYEVKFGSRDLVFIDPPRSGCPSSVISAVAGQKPRNICLVSCFLDSHVHDLKQWQEEGYHVVSMAAFDMFPFTEFMENLTLLERKG